MILGFLGLSSALGIWVAVNEVMGGKGRRSRSRERWGQYSHGQHNWHGGKGQWRNEQYPQYNGKGKGYGKTSYSNPTTRAASLLQELHDISKQQQQEAQATSLLQRFAGVFGQPSHGSQDAGNPAWPFNVAQASMPQGETPSWLKTLLDGLASKFSGAPTEAPSSRSTPVPTGAPVVHEAKTHDDSKQHAEDMAKLRLELESLRRAEKERLMAEIDKMRGSADEAKATLPTCTSPPAREGKQASILDWLDVDVEEWDLDEVVLTTAQQKAWIAKVRPSSAKGYTRSACSVSNWLAAEKLRISDEDLNTALVEAGMRKASVLTRDLYILRLLVKVMQAQQKPE